MKKLDYQTKDEWNEDQLVEQPAIKLFKKMGYDYRHGSELNPESDERDSYHDVLLIKRLRKAIKRLNPWINENNLNKAVSELQNEQGTTLTQTNSLIYEKLVSYISVMQDLGKGRKGQTVKYIDFENIDNNEFLIVNQYKISGRKENIKPDLIIFINGIPIGVIECKSPTIFEPLNKGLDQMMRYQNLREPDTHEGAEKLFHYNQISSVIWKNGAVTCTVGAKERYYKAWKTPYPKNKKELKKYLGKKPTKQDILIYGVYNKKNLLDIIRNFIVFEPEGGKIIKKITRYVQYRAVKKAIKRILKKEGDKRGGVVWHTQGSGKSLEMVFLATKLKRIKELENPTIIIVTDRVELDKQISTTFENVGFPNPVQADSITSLKKLIKQGKGRTITTTIHKFQEENDEEEYPELDTEQNIFLLVDEAHRTQYKTLAMNMRKALPNACYIGFTGTPIDKKDKSTRRVFGEYIDTYTIEQSVDDNMTVPIYYEGRMPKLNIEGMNIDELFDRVFKNRSEKEKEKIKERYVTERAIAEAKSRIKQICLDIIKHYEEHIKPNGYKAQIVTVSREAAVIYKETLDELNGPESAVIMSIDHNDSQRMKQYKKSKTEEDNIIGRFKKKKDPLSFLIVCDKLLTGFDAPIEQVMYLDKSLKEHNLLQAIARVNRTYKGKSYGLIIDYWGVSNFLKEALIIFNKKDIKGALTPLTDELTRLRTRYNAVMRFFKDSDLNDLEKCTDKLEPEDVRLKFDIAFKKFSESMDMLMPDPSAKAFYNDLKKLGKIREYARNRFRDENLNLAGCGEKVKKLINESIKSSGIKQLHKPVSIISKKYDELLESLKSDKARASEMEHAIKYEIRVKYEENPVFYHSVKQKLDEIIKLKEQNRIETSKIVDELDDLINEVKNLPEKAKELGFNKHEYSYYLLLKDLIDINEKDASKVTKELVKSLKSLTVVDWKIKDDIQRKMRKEIKNNLIKYDVPLKKLNPITNEFMELTIKSM